MLPLVILSTITYYHHSIMQWNRYSLHIIYLFVVFSELCSISCDKSLPFLQSVMSKTDNNKAVKATKFWMLGVRSSWPTPLLHPTTYMYIRILTSHHLKVKVVRRYNLIMDWRRAHGASFSSAKTKTSYIQLKKNLKLYSEIHQLHIVEVHQLETWLVHM